MRMWLHFWERSLMSAFRWAKSVTDHVLFWVGLVAVFGVVLTIRPWRDGDRPLAVPLLWLLVIVLLLVCHGAYLTWKDDTAPLRSQDGRRNALALLLGRADMLLKLVWLAGIGRSFDPPLMVESDEGSGVLHTPNTRTVVDRVSAWTREADEYLANNFGQAEVVVFRSDVGVPGDLGSLDFDESRAPEEADLYQRLQRRIYRLQQLMEQLPRQ